MSKTIVITSGKGGVGKTSISVNTALELSQRNYRTCLFDADFGLANVDILLGLRPERTLDDFIFGGRNLDEIIIHSDVGIDIIPGSSGIEKVANLAPEKISELSSAFSRLAGYDYFLIDTSSGISRGVIAFCLASSETIIVITSEATSLIDAYALVKVMAANKYKGTVKVLVNNCPDVPISKRTYLRFKTAVDNHLNIDIAPAGIVLNDPNIEVSLTRQKPLLTLFPNSIASQCIRSVVSILLRNDTTEDRKADFGEFWKRYFDLSTSELSLPDKQHEINSSESTYVPVDNDAPPLSPAPSEPEEDQTPEAEDSTTADEPLQSIAIEPSIAPEDNDEDMAYSQKADALEPHLPEEEDSPPDISPETTVPVSQSDLIIDALSLASPTPLLSKCLELQGKGELSQKKLLEIFTSDPALMVKALKMFCTRGAIGSPRLTSIHQIIKELGPEVLSSLLTKTTMQSALSDLTASATDPGFINEFWYHSCKSGFLAQHIAETLKYPYPEEAFIGGLIHDIGRLALQTNYPETYVQFPHTLQHEERVLETEKRIFGRNHAIIGADMLRAWNLSSFISDAVRYHSESESRIETAFDLVKIVFVASQMVHSPHQDMEESDDHEEGLLGLTKAQLQVSIEKSEKMVAQIADRFNIPITKGVERMSAEESQALFRRQAVDYSLLQGVLPNPMPNRALPQIIRQIHQGLDILFGIKNVLCLMPDDQLSCLQAVGYPDCFGSEILTDISLSFRSGKSFIVESFATNKLNIVMEDETQENLSLGDEQIIRYLSAEGLACLPMVVHNESMGVIIFGIQKEEMPNINKLQSRLEQFGAQSARNIVALEQTASHNYATSPSSSTQDREAQGNIFNLTHSS